jgi:uncharacterized protein (TIGR00299 family) protein
MKILYIDCYSGISGDMFLGALIAAGLDIDKLRAELSKLGVKNFEISSRRVKRQCVAATKFDVVVKDLSRDRERTLKDILTIIEKSALDKDVKRKSAGIFRSIARAECAVHGKAVKDLHFHEVGDIDSIVDIIGAVAGLKILGIDKVYSSPVTVGGGGSIITSHGTLPVPAPATACLLKGIPIAASSVRSELVTPTGAAILANLVDSFTPAPGMVLKEVGYGAGSYKIKEHPNCLRVMVGEASGSFEEDKVFVVEANIDDMNPMDYEYLFEKLFKEGALDVYLAPVQMKKSRPGIVLTALVKNADLDRMASIIFSESTTIGVRYYEARRKKLKREFTNIKTSFGKVRVKVSSGPGGIEKFTPEYDDCKRLAGLRNVPISRIRGEVARTAKK